MTVLLFRQNTAICYTVVKDIKQDKQKTINMLYFNIHET